MPHYTRPYTNRPYSIMFIPYSTRLDSSLPLHVSNIPYLSLRIRTRFLILILLLALMFIFPLIRICLSYATHALLYSTLLYSTLPYSTLLLLYSNLLYSTLLYYTHTLLYATLLYSTLLYSTRSYSTLAYSTLRYSTLFYSHQVTRNPALPYHYPTLRSATIRYICSTLTLLYSFDTPLLYSTLTHTPTRYSTAHTLTSESYSTIPYA